MKKVFCLDTKIYGANKEIVILGGKTILRGAVRTYEECHKVINGIEYKLCSICNEWLEMESSFYKNKSASDGHNPYCKKCTINKSTNYRKTNEEYREKMKIFYKSDIHKKRRKSWRECNKEHIDEYSQEYRQSEHGKEKYQEYGVKRKAKKHEISKQEWKDCKEYFNNKCAYCGLDINDHKRKYGGILKNIDLHKEHVNDEGSNDLSNCVPSCQSCNSQKRNMKFDEWYNVSNPDYTKERYEKIIEWLESDFKLYINKNKLIKEI